MNYKDTLNLPQTAFSMKANAAVKEPETQKFWEENHIYEKNLAQRNKQHKFVLHDGPPYLSSDKIHIGTALNKVLKDIVVKYKSQSGFYSPYVPGYDGHGLPIENAVVKSIKGGREAITPLELRQKSREFALKNLKGQEDNFKRLGVWGDWAHPYITIAADFEAQQVRIFGEINKKGYVYKGLKPVYWCAECETALAEAEVEYADHKSTSIYVKFQFTESDAAKLNINKPLFMVIWTTTPWTLPANLAIAVHPNFEYLFVQKSEEVYVIAKDLLESTVKDIGWEEGSYKILGSIKGEKLEYLNTMHPFMGRESMIILGDHVTTEAGTGAVHTAPGHGIEDYEVAIKYKLGVISPLTDKGVFTAEAGKYEGIKYNKANAEIVNDLQESGALLSKVEIMHSYPHCWRCKSPVIYRATEQWFINVEAFRDKALKAIDEVQWIPTAGRQRIYNMVESRSDWCISRQRVWGVPIPVFYCYDCGKPIITDETIENVARVFEKETSDAWCKYSADELLPEGFRCPFCASDHFRKENDIMDVWFDSGITHSAVVDARKDELCGSPVELYLEGSDQHRGWFQSSLLTSVATKDRAPYKAVLTHGFVLDAQGRKMSKSMGNVTEPQKIVNQYGADVLRLWVASVDYTNDVKIGDNIVQQLVEVYRKVRNSVRFILGNLYDFNPSQHAVKYEDLNEIDRYALHRLQLLVEKVSSAFYDYEFYKYYQLMQNFAAIDLSALYFDIVKDRLYTAGKDSLTRRSSQTVLYEILNVLTRMLVPVTPHLAEDIWKHVIPEQRGELESILLSDWPEVNEKYKNQALSDKWDKIIHLREIVTKAIEPARALKQIGSSLETAVYVKVEDQEALKSVQDELKNVFITSQAFIISDGEEPQNVLNTLQEEGYTVYVTPALGEKCPRCWKFTRNEGEEICIECKEAL
ncbi:MAG: isoleucine--tRNA ligase [Candidatus Melainabacteria bacterium GWF2_37_15]|nr:MAG: isoleucine--tRNA ligase [Candidatus Melainabacteria bacterium GWF2_37_15]